MNVTGRIFDAPPMCWATSVAEKVEAVAAATMPRGAIQPVNARSPAVMSVRSVARKADREDQDEADPNQHLVGRHGSCQFSAYQAAIRSVTFRPPHSRASIRDGHRDTRSTRGMS